MNFERSYFVKVILAERIFDCVNLRQIVGGYVQTCSGKNKATSTLRHTVGVLFGSQMARLRHPDVIVLGLHFALYWYAYDLHH